MYWQANKNIVIDEDGEEYSTIDLTYYKLLLLIWILWSDYKNNQGRYKGKLKIKS